MTPAELPGYLAEIRARVEASAVPVAAAIGSEYEDHLKNVTLVESGAHDPVTRTPAAPGRPPALMPGGLNGSLRDSVLQGPTVSIGAGIAETSVAPHVIYAATQEHGGVHHAKSGGFMWLWVGYIGPAAVKRRGWRKTVVDIPARPFMSTAVEESVANGSLVRSAAEMFMAVVWGR